MAFNAGAAANAHSDLSAVRRAAILFGFLCSIALFYVFTYNSGYGYDALEYLVIGRALSQGQAFYALIPSKSPGIYYVLATFFLSGLPRNHYTVSAVVTVFFAATVTGTWCVVRRYFGYGIVLMSTLLVAACAVFMEMNFLEPESAVFISGLAAFVLVLRSLGTGKLLTLFAAGFCLAVGFQFKSVAALYLIGILCFLAFRRRRQGWALLDFLRVVAPLSTGFIIGSSIPLLIFALAGKFSEFWTWTIKFPLFSYPSNTLWLDKLYTKLLWFHVLLVVTFACSVVVRSRRVIWDNSAAVLAFFMGLASYLALLKTQASHYCFPGAAFFSIFIAATLLTCRKKTGNLTLTTKWLAVAATGALSVLTISIVCYRPKAISRFLEWRNYQDEELLGSQVRQELVPGGKALFVRNGTLLYWVSGVEPATRFIHFDVQTTYFVERNPDALLNAINNHSTSIVEFDPLNPGFEDEGFDDLAKRSSLLAEFTRQLEKTFRPAEASPTPFHFWVRKTVEGSFVRE